MIKLLSSGFYTSIQDLGRFGSSDIGVPVSGAMDLYSAKLANHILGNNDTNAILEITLGKCKLLFDRQMIICISGANLSPKLNNKNITLNSPIEINKGDILTFDKPVYGVRCYLSISGGFQTDVVLNSRSFYKGITDKYVLKKNDILPINVNRSKISKSFSSVKINKQHFVTTIIEAYAGPEYELLDKKQREELNKTMFTISKENNRMGYRLEELMVNKLDSMLTSAVLPGTVQLTPSGKLIILMRDCQVTGGYPRVLQLTDDAINKLAQKTTNDTFKFKITPL
ncbi:MAG: biotin-dependent carboxyltransferase family protein [Flavobacteriaceae bacterium]|nr:biotin-dependent carboxyltransferase family protein [Flavobacteriaceae bacterium]